MRPDGSTAVCYAQRVDAGFRRTLRTLGPACAAAMLWSCVTPPAPPPAETPTGVAAPAARSIEYYRLDPARSALTVFVYRGGPLARFGHNHVVEARELEGFVRRAEPLEASYLELAFRAADLVIDDAAARAAAGEEFAALPPPEAIEGTRNNMLGAALLAAAEFPYVLVRSRSVTPAPGGATLRLEARVKHHVGSFEVPVALVIRGNELEATGEVVLSQRALGLEPFSVMAGALQVQDELTIRFRAVAVR
jgi:hypothetical protein